MSHIGQKPGAAEPAQNADVGVLITTFNGVHHAEGNIALIRAAWRNAFPAVRIVHAFNGRPNWYRQRTGEDILVRTGNGPSHFQGAAKLLNVGLDAFQAANASGTGRWRTPVRYVVALAADTWITNPEWLSGVIDEMRRQQLPLAAASWAVEKETAGLRRVGGPKDVLTVGGLSTDFFVVDLQWAYRNELFPLRYSEFLKSNEDLIDFSQELMLLETYFSGRMVHAARKEMLDYFASVERGDIPDDEIEPVMKKDPFGSQGPRHAGHLTRMIDERTIDPKNGPIHKSHWPEIGLHVIEDAAAKQELVRSLDEDVLARSPFLRRLATATSLDWYNAVQLGRPAVMSEASPAPSL